MIFFYIHSTLILGGNMAYIKYKELTKYFNFSKELDIDNLPNYVTDYLKDNEKIEAVLMKDSSLERTIVKRLKGILSNMLKDIVFVDK